MEIILSVNSICLFVCLYINRSSNIGKVAIITPTMILLWVQKSRKRDVVRSLRTNPKVLVLYAGELIGFLLSVTL